MVVSERVFSMKLSEIEKRISFLPTIMDISDELQVISELMDISYDDLNGDKDIFCSIVKQVAISHIDSGFLELTSLNEGEFIRFYHWLNKVNVELGIGLNNNIIENFNLTVDEVQKSMQS